MSGGCDRGGGAFVTWWGFYRTDTNCVLPLLILYSVCTLLQRVHVLFNWQLCGVFWRVCCVFTEFSLLDGWYCMFKANSFRFLFSLKNIYQPRRKHVLVVVATILLSVKITISRILSNVADSTINYNY